MALGVPSWVSEISSILGFWTIVGIITFLVLCWRRIYYVCHLQDARRGRIQSIQDEIRSLRDLNSGRDGANSQALHRIISDQEQRLDILSETEDSLWFRFSAFFRADPCLRRLEELEKDLKQRVQRMTDVRLMILGAHTARQPDAALPTAEVSTPQTHEAGATHQPAQSASRAFSSGHSTIIESMPRTGNLRHRPTTPTSEATGRSFNRPGVDPYLRAAFNDDDPLRILLDRILVSDWCQQSEEEPVYGSQQDRACTGKDEFQCLICPKHLRLQRVLRHIRSHFDIRPFVCHDCPDCRQSKAPHRATCLEGLNEHIRARFAGKQPCSICGDLFRKGNMTRHMQEQHSRI